MSDCKGPRANRGLFYCHSPLTTHHSPIHYTSSVPSPHRRTLTMRSFGCAIGVAAVLLAVAPRSWSSGQEQKEAQALLDKAIQAHGGEANLAKGKAITFRGAGHVRVGGDFPMTAELVAQGTTHMKFVADVNVNGMNIRLVKVINGDKGW